MLGCGSQPLSYVSGDPYGQPVSRVNSRHCALVELESTCSSCTRLRAQASTIYKIIQCLRTQAHNLKSTNSSVSHGVLSTSTSSRPECLLKRDLLYRDNSRKAPFVRSNDSVHLLCLSDEDRLLSVRQWYVASTETKQMFRSDSISVAGFFRFPKIYPKSLSKPHDRVHSARSKHGTCALM